MGIIFGVDSKSPANVQLTNGYSLYDWVIRQNSFPDFWGRDLDGEDAITTEEREYLKKKNCKVALIVRNLTEIAVSSVDGTNDALHAVEAAKMKGVPQHNNIALFAEIHSDWSVNHNWMISFAQTVYENGYVPGFIGNTDSSKNFNFDRQCSHYVQATKEAGNFNAVYWATEPQLPEEPREWAPFYPSALQANDIGLWRMGTIGLNDVSANQTYARDESLLNYMW